MCRVVLQRTVERGQLPQLQLLVFVQVVVRHNQQPLNHGTRLVDLQDGNVRDCRQG